MNVTFPFRYVVAPMVDLSDLAFRLLCRRHGAHVAFTEMLYSDKVAKDPDYRKAHLQTCAEDRPLVVQLCGNDPEVMVQAGKLVQNSCDAIDINLGCPQKRAEEGHYGSYLLGKEDWELVFQIVGEMSSRLKVPIFCKIRLLPTLAMSLQFCKGLERAGCSVLTVHGRMRGSQTDRRAGFADLEAIRAIKLAMSIPVIANGNVRCPSDVKANLAFTGADGVMSAEAILRDPLLFHGDAEPRTNMLAVAMEYLQLCREHNTPLYSIRQHLHWMLGRQGRGGSISYAYNGGYKRSIDLKRSVDACVSIDEFGTIVKSSLGLHFASPPDRNHS